MLLPKGEKNRVQLSLKNSLQHTLFLSLWRW
jgi:hypothetical protein